MKPVTITVANGLFHPGDRVYIAGEEFVITGVKANMLNVRKPRWWQRVHWRVAAWMARWDRRFEERYGRF